MMNQENFHVAVAAALTVTVKEPAVGTALYLATVVSISKGVIITTEDAVQALQVMTAAVAAAAIADLPDGLLMVASPGEAVESVEVSRIRPPPVRSTANAEAPATRPEIKPWLPVTVPAAEKFWATSMDVLLNSNQLLAPPRKRAESGMRIALSPDPAPEIFKLAFVAPLPGSPVIAKAIPVPLVRVTVSEKVLGWS